LGGEDSILAWGFVMATLSGLPWLPRFCSSDGSPENRPAFPKGSRIVFQASVFFRDIHNGGKVGNGSHFLI